MPRASVDRGEVAGGRALGTPTDTEGSDQAADGGAKQGDPLKSNTGNGRALPPRENGSDLEKSLIYSSRN